MLTVHSANADEGDWWIDLSVGAYHGDRSWKDKEDGSQHRYNEFNPGAGLTYNINENVDVSGGTFYNSFKRWSLYGGLGLKYPIRLSGKMTWEPGFFAGFASGYEGTAKDDDVVVLGLIPFPAVSNIVRYDDYALKVGVVPDYKGTKKSGFTVITFQLSYQFM